MKTVNLVRPVELKLGLADLAGCTLNVGAFRRDSQLVSAPPGLPTHQLEAAEYLLPWEVHRASTRHRIVRDFCDRLYQAFGLAQAIPVFRSGQLYTRAGVADHMSIAGGGVWTDDGKQVGRVLDDGAIWDAHANVVAFTRGGVIADRDGYTLAVI